MDASRFYWTVIFVAALLCSSHAWAEPSVGGGHIVFLMIVAGAGAVGVGATPYFVKKYALPGMPTWLVWVLGAVGFLATAVVGGPIIVVLGSILITGRTM